MNSITRSVLVSVSVCVLGSSHGCERLKRAFSGGDDGPGGASKGPDSTEGKKDGSKSDVKVFNGVTDGFPDAVSKAIVRIDGICSGSLISATRVLTAAHCVARRNSAGEFIMTPEGHVLPNPGYVGQVTFGVRQDGPTIRSRAGSLRVHSKLDIATFELSRAPGAGFAPLEIWRDGEFALPVGFRIHIFGFGWADPAQSVRPGRALRGVVEFQRFIEELKYRGGLTFRSLLKFTSTSTLQGSKPGDSGGPAMGWQAGEWKQIGVISGAVEGDDPSNSPTFLADARASRNWILAGLAGAEPGTIPAPPIVAPPTVAPPIVAPPIVAPPSGVEPPPASPVSRTLVTCFNGSDPLNVRDASLATIVGTLGPGVTVTAWDEFVQRADGVRFRRISGPNFSAPGVVVEGFAAANLLCEP